MSEQKREAELLELENWTRDETEQDAFFSEGAREQTGDYPEKTDELVQQIYGFMKQKDSPREQRMQFVRECLQHYNAEQIGERSKHYFLQLLADVVLHEELTDRDSYKVTHQEYPILSKWQLEYRHRKEFSMKLAEEYASDGKWYKRNIS